MKKYLPLIILLIPLIAYAAPPQRQNVYVTGTTIKANDVTENEDEIFNYLNVGVDTIRTDGLDNIAEINSTIKSGSDQTLVTGTKGSTDRLGVWNGDGDLVGTTALGWTESTAFLSTGGSMSMATAYVTGNLHLTGLDCTGNSNSGALTTDSFGLVSCSDDDNSGGSSIDTLNDVGDVNTATAANGQILYNDGVQWHALTLGTDSHVLTADSSLAGGVKWAASSGGATQLTGLSDVNSATATAGNILVGDGAVFDSVSVSGDATLGSNGSITVTDLTCTNCIGPTEITDSYVLNSTNDSMNGILTLDGIVLGANENITMGSENFYFDDSPAGFRLLNDLYVGNSGVFQIRDWQNNVTDGVLASLLGSVYFSSQDQKFIFSEEPTSALSIEFNSAWQQLVLGSYDATGNQIIITNSANTGNDHDHNTQTNPTLYIHSDTDPNSANDEWISLTHDKTNPIIDWGSGTLQLGSTSSGVSINSNLDSFTDINSSTATKGSFIVNDGNQWHSWGVTGSSDQVIVADSTQPFGVKWATQTGGGSSQLTDLADVNTATVTHGNMFFANGTNWNATDKIQMKSGQLVLKDYDCTGNANSGALTADANGIVSCSDDDGGAGGGDNITVNSTAADTTGNFLDGDIDFTLVDGGAGGPDDITATVGCTDCISQPEIDFLNSATATSGNILMADGSQYHAIALSSDVVLSWNGTATIQADSVALTTDTTGNYVTSITNGSGISGGDGGSEGAALTLAYNGSLTNNSDVNSATAAKGSILVSDSAGWNAIGIGSDTQVLTADSTLPFGVGWAASSGGASQLTGLADVNSATSTLNNILAGTGGDGFISRALVEADISDLSHTTDEVGTLTTGDLCINDGSSVNCTVNTEAELETALDSLDVVTVTAGDISEANLESILSDVSNVFTNNDGALNDDDLSNDALTALSNVNSSTTTSGNILLADGSNFHSVTLSGDVNIAWNGTATIPASSISLSELSDVNSATASIGGIIQADGGAWNSRTAAREGFQVDADSSGGSMIQFGGCYSSNPCPVEHGWGMFKKCATNVPCWCNGGSAVLFTDNTTSCF